jgi:hypothetical protein
MTTRNYSSRSQQTTLTSAVTAGASTLVVQSGAALLGGQSIPAGTTFTIVVDPDTAIEEIIDATAVSTNTFTITRAIDGSSAQGHSAGAVVRHMAIGRDYRESNAHIEASTGVHGISNSSSVVGTIDTQTLTNKTLTAPTITNPIISGTNVDASIVFEGATPDAFETTLTVAEPTQDNTITLPNTTGTVVIANAAQTLTNKTMGDALNAGGFKITNLATPTLASDAVRKDFADAQVAAAATSAASAAASATAASTSAASAATSASAALTSANSASTSAASSLTSANSAATSASTMAASVSAAATSAASAATSATAAATSAASASASQTAAATSATSAAASATAAATSATSSAVSATAAATSATSAAASATTAANSVASIATYATNASNSATAAATSATSAATSATAAATSASSAATSASSALTSQTAASTSATSAAASATAAATSETNAATSASSALTSQTAAATSAASALTSQTAAATSATSSANSATAADNSAGAASGYATAASTSAASAATSASSAATTYDNFDDRYLGSKSSAPTVDNDGNTLLVGAIYWNSTLGNMYVWSGSAWVQIATTSVYTAPTLGSTTIDSGTTYSTVTGLTLNNGLASADPSTALGLATKQYVDAVVTQINYHEAVTAATTNNLGVTYNNGSSGVGATLTADTLREFNTLDGATVSVGQRVLIKNQTTQLQNGIYTLTNNGSAGVTAWVLTRATDADNNPSGEMKNGDELACINGTVNAGKSFINSTTVAPIVIGTTAITFSDYYTGLPAQSGNSGRYLTTDGTTPSWGTVTTYSAPTLGSTSIGSGATVTNVNGLTINSTTIPTSKTLVVTTDKLNALASTTSAELAGVISDKTGTGALVFANTPTLVTPSLGVATATSINGTSIPSSATLIKTSDTGTVTSTMIADGTIVDADINASAAIAQSKVSSLTTDLAAKAPLTIPNDAKGSAYSVVVGDNGRLINISTGGVTVATTTAMSAGQNFVIHNNSGSNQTITQGASVTLRLAGTATTGNRTLAQYGVATVLCVASNTYIISGAGLS